MRFVIPEGQRSFGIVRIDYQLPPASSPDAGENEGHDKPDNLVDNDVAGPEIEVIVTRTNEQATAFSSQKEADDRRKVLAWIIQVCLNRSKHNIDIVGCDLAALKNLTGGAVRFSFWERLTNSLVRVVSMEPTFADSPKPRSPHIMLRPRFSTNA